MSPTDKIPLTIPLTIAATVAAFRANAPTQWRESENVMKFAMEFFETGVTADVGLIYDIETLPKAERDAATENLKEEFDRIVIASILKRLASLFGGTTHVFGVDRGRGGFHSRRQSRRHPRVEGVRKSTRKDRQTENEEGGKESD